MPLPTARKAVPIAAVVLPLPGPVFTMMRPRRISSGMNVSLLVAAVIWMAFEDCKCAIELFQQNHACQLVGKSHLAERELERRGLTRLGREPVRATDSE